MSTNHRRSRVEWLFLLGAPLSVAVPMVRGAYGPFDPLFGAALAACLVGSLGIVLRGGRRIARRIARGGVVCLGATLLWWNLYGWVEAAWLRGSVAPWFGYVWHAATAASNESVLLEGGRMWLDPGGGALVFRPTIEKTCLVPVSGWVVFATGCVLQRDGFRCSRNALHSWLRRVVLPGLAVAMLGSTLLVAVFASVYDPFSQPGGTVLQVFHHRWSAFGVASVCAWIGAAVPAEFEA